MYPLNLYKASRIKMDIISRKDCMVVNDKAVAYIEYTLNCTLENIQEHNELDYFHGIRNSKLCNKDNNKVLSLPQVLMSNLDKACTHSCNNFDYYDYTVAYIDTHLDSHNNHC